MLVKDEGDVVAHTIRHLLTQVDEIIALDNLSTDNTLELLLQLAVENPELIVGTDPEVGYYQARKTTALAQQARERGHTWVVPCDADEVWYSPFGRIGDLLEGLEPQWQFALADLYDHIATDADPPYGNPLERIRWRFVAPGKLPKTAARLHPSLQIEMGNHGASLVAGTRVRADGSPPSVKGRLKIRHFSWRSEDQYLRKITNGARAYAAAEKLDAFGDHWKAFGPPESTDFEARVRAHYQRWFFVSQPATRSDLIFDPAPFGEARDV